LASFFLLFFLFSLSFLFLFLVFIYLFIYFLFFFFFFFFFPLEICPAKGGTAFSPYSLPGMLNSTHGKGAMAERKIKGGRVTQWPPL
jgi:hypothetical protein